MAQDNESLKRDPESSAQRTIKKLKLTSLNEALLCVPSGYIDSTNAYNSLERAHVAGLYGQNKICVRVVLAPGQKDPSQIDIVGFGDSWQRPLASPWGYWCKRQRIKVYDAQGAEGYISCFGPSAVWREVAPLTELHIYGLVSKWNHEIQIANPVFLSRKQIGKVWPVYRGIQGKVSGAAVEAAIQSLEENGRWQEAIEHCAKEAIEHCAKEVELACSMPSQQIMSLVHGSLSAEQLPLAQMAMESWSLHDLINSLHRPTALELAHLAQRCVTKVCALALQVQAELANRRPPNINCPVGTPTQMSEFTNCAITQIERVIGGQVTENQRNVALAIAADVCGNEPLNGLLSGEVGAGKTVAFLAPAVAAHWMGAKVAITAPTLLLADQIAHEIHNFFGREVQVERIEEGGRINDVQSILVGTESLSTICAKAKYVPDLVVFDEQHKTEVQVRDSLVGPMTHKIEVSATPVGRSLALAMFPGMRLYTLDQQPVHKEIRSYLIDVRQRQNAVNFIYDAIVKGKRAAIILPRVDKRDSGSASPADEVAVTQNEVGNAKSTFEAFSSAFPGQTALLHGSMGNDEKRRALEQYRANKAPILISTTVMETGISVPDITVMIVRDPERFGAFQLHQLRGRLARRGGQAIFMMMTESIDALSPSTLDRLRSVESTSNGYELAVMDMLNRGAGNFNTTEQTGGTSTVFKLLDWTIRDWLFDDNNRFELDIQFDDVSVNAVPAPSRSNQVALF